MTRIFLTCSLTAVALAMAPLSVKAQTTRGDEKGVRKTDRVLTDAEFLQRAAADGLLETTLAGMVDDQTDDEALEKYADWIDEGHDKANREIVTLAEKKGVDVPNTMNDRRKQMIDQMGKLKGKAFEQRYLRQQVAGHERSVRMFAAEAEHGQDPEIREFARKTLPVLREHLKKAQEFASARGITTRDSAVPASNPTAPTKP